MGIRRVQVAMGARVRLATLALMTSCALLGAPGCGSDPDDAPTGSSAEAAPSSPPDPGEGAEDAEPEQALIQIDDPELDPFKGDLDEIRERRVIRALVVHSRTDFFLESGRIKGIQAELMREFGKSLNKGRKRESERIRIKYVPVKFGDLIPALEQGRGDLIAAFLTETKARAERVQFVSGLRDRVSEVLVTNRSTPTPTDLTDLAGMRIYVLNGSSYIDHLREMDDWLAAENLERMTIIEADKRLESEDILELVNAGTVHATVVDDYKARLWAQVLPNITVHEHMTIAEGRRAGWAVRQDSPQLAQELARFTERSRKGTLFGNIVFERYLGSAGYIDDPTGRAERDKLKRYRSLFDTYGGKYEWRPLILAAQAYQESHLDHGARSRSGAVGLMQLLPSTARDKNVDIPDIHDVEKNVHAGAKYMAFLRDRYFTSDSISKWDQAALSLAAYNAGPRRIREARQDAERLGLDPNVWFDNVEVATGRRVGREPVRYVSNIYKYYVAFKLAEQREQERTEFLR